MLKAQRTERQVARYQNDVNQIFRDVKKPGAQPVQVLLAKQEAAVAEVADSKTVAVVTNAPAEVGQVWTSTQGQHVVEEVQDTKVRFQHDHGLVVGDTLHQSQLLASTEEIHQAFAEEWVKRWDRDLAVPASQWDEVNAFVDLALPAGQMECSPLSLENWKATIKAKKTKSAVGMDGVSRQDLLALPDQLHMEVLALLEKAENTGVWPQQALHGAIHSLAKKADASQVGDYRPVTILPLIYRCWSSFRAAEVLRYIARVAPSTMYGNMLGRSSPAVWYQLQARIEQCLYDGESCSGVVSDLIKAFNQLPRGPIFHAAVQIGIHPRIVKGWLGAVSGITRHVFVRGQPGPGLKSFSGFPEGCGLSVAAMSLCNLIIHSFMNARCPRTVFCSYVDNLVAVGNSA